MKLYNPFRAHIIELQYPTRFAVRRLSWLGWEFYDNQQMGPEHFWWFRNRNYVFVDTLEQARQVLCSATGNPIKVYTQ